MEPTPVVVPQPEKSIDLLSSPVKASELSQNLKLAKSSAPKVVKKKKRVSRVGLGREDDDDDEPAASVAPTHGLVHSHSLPSVAETTHDGEHSDGESEAHSTVPASIVSNAESESATSAFDFLMETTATVPVSEETTTSHTGNRPSLLSFSMPESAPVAVPAALSLADFDGMIVHNDTVPNPNSAVPAKPVVVPTQQPAKTVVVPHTPAITTTAEAKIVEPVKDSSVGKTTQEKSVTQLNKFYDLVVSLSQIHSNSVQESKRIRELIESENSNLGLLKGQLVSLEAEQAKHAAEEDFDRADMMTSPIESTRGEIEKKVGLIDTLQQQALQVEATFAAQRQQVVLVINQTFSELTAVKDQLMVEAAELESQQVEGNELEEIRIRVEEERISLEKSHFEKEETALAEELRVTEDAIKSQSGAVQVKKEEIEISLLSVQGEIKLLEQQLAAKRNEEQQLQKELTLVDTKITEVRKKYERQLQRIQDRSYALAETKRECLAEEAALMQEKEAYARQAQEALDARESFVGWTRSVRDDLQVMDLFVKNTEKAEEDFRLLTNSVATSAGDQSRSGGDDKTAALQAAQNEALSALNQATTCETEMRQQMEDLSAEGRAILEQIPKLEAEKKAHAGAKRFKEAAAVAKDIKDGQSRKDEIDLKIEELARAVVVAGEEVARAREAYNEASRALKDVQREVDIQRCRSLLARAKELRSLLKKVSRVKVSMGSYKLSASLSSSVNDVSAKVAAFFTSELSDVLEVARCIQREHCLPQEMFAEAEKEEEEEEVVTVESEQGMSVVESDSTEEFAAADVGATESVGVEEIVANLEDQIEAAEEAVTNATEEQEETVKEEAAPVPVEVDLAELKVNLCEAVNGVILIYSELEISYCFSA